MTGNISYLFEYEPYDGGYISFGHGDGKITGKGIIKTDFKLNDDTNVLLRTPRQHNMYSIDLNNIVPHKNLTCLVAKASVDEKMNEFCTKKGIGREFSNARTPQQNGVAKRRNKTLIETARTMLVDAKLPVTFWAEVVNTACYVQNRFLVNKSQNKTSYELFNSRIPAIGFLRPFGCHVMILNTLDHLGKFDAKGDEGYFVGYSLSSKAFRVFNKRRTSSTNILGIKDVASQAVKEDVSSLRYIALPNWFHEAHMETSNDTIRNSDAQDDSQKEQDCNTDVSESSGISNPTATSKVPLADQVEPAVSLTVESDILTVSSPVPIVCLVISPESSSGPRLISKGVFSQKETPSLGNVLTLSNRFEDTIGDTTNAVTLNEVEADLSNIETSIPEERKKIFDAFKDPSWVKAMQEELLQFKIQNVWVLVNCLKRVKPIGTKWVLKNKKDKRGIVIRNKTRLVAQGYTQEERIDYEEVFAPVARIEAIRLFLAYALFIGFIVYQMDVKSAFLYRTINEEVYVMQPLEFQDPEFPERVYKLCRGFEALLHDKFQMSAMGELTFFLGLQVLQKKMASSSHKTSMLVIFSRSLDTQMLGQLILPWTKRILGEKMDLIHDWIIMYLTASRPDIMFAVCACARHQVTPKECHPHAVKRIFRYLKDHPKLGLWYPKECSFDLVAYSDSDYDGATQDRKSTTGGCQFPGRRLISWQCKKQTIVATSTTEAEYVAAASGCRQVLWIQNQMLDYRLSKSCDDLYEEITSYVLMLFCNNESLLKDLLKFLTVKAL
nr:hypothetical protein [Tanacetum cinerariifolium]